VQERVKNNERNKARCKKYGEKKKMESIEWKLEVRRGVKKAFLSIPSGTTWTPVSGLVGEISASKALL